MAGMKNVSTQYALLGISSTLSICDYCINGGGPSSGLVEPVAPRLSAGRTLVVMSSLPTQEVGREAAGTCPVSPS
jgi:hypothetical protein